MPLNIQSFAQLVSNQAAACQAKSTALIDFTIGSIMRAFIEATASVALWLEGLVVYTLSLTRAKTCQGTDLDSWVNQFGLYRLSASLAAGDVTFARFSPTSAGLIPIPTTVRTLDGTQSFTVSLDPTNQAYSSAQNGYVIPIGVTSVTVPVVANVPGPGANVAAATIGLIASAVPGIDTVTNAAPLTGGATAQSDPSLLATIPLYFGSFSKATSLAIGFAITSLQLGAEYTIIENTDTAGRPAYGFFLVTVDDGTGTPSAAFVNTCAAAVESTRALSVRYAVMPPVIINVSVSFSISVATGYDPNTIVGIAGDAVISYINALSLGTSLPYDILPEVIYDSSPGIRKDKGLNILLNNGIADVDVTDRNVIKALTVSASISPT